MTEQEKQQILTRIDLLCEKKGISPTTAFTESGVGKNFKSNLKKASPSLGKLTMLAHYFHVSVEYLTGKTEECSPLSAESITDAQNDRERLLLAAYRSQPELQFAVDRILGIEMEDYVRVYSAAKSDGSRPEQITYMRRDKWEKLLASEDPNLKLL